MSRVGRAFASSARARKRKVRAGVGFPTAVRAMAASAEFFRRCPAPTRCGSTATTIGRPLRTSLSCASQWLICKSNASCREMRALPPSILPQSGFAGFLLTLARSLVSVANSRSSSLLLLCRIRPNRREMQLSSGIGQGQLLLLNTFFADPMRGLGVKAAVEEFFRGHPSPG